MSDATDWFVIALGLPDSTGEGPLAGEILPMPPGAVSVDAQMETSVDDHRAVRDTHTYYLWHVAVPPRSGKRYHVLVPSTMRSWEQVFVATSRMLVEADETVHDAIACPNALCELTSLENVVGS